MTDRLIALGDDLERAARKDLRRHSRRRRRVLGGARNQPPEAPLSRGLEVHPDGGGADLDVWIDRSLVRDLDVDPQQFRITAAILVMAHAFDLVPIAEGVQTEGEADALRQLGCRYGQGYYWGAPMPAAALERLLV